jgi:hypothetical protein
MNRPPVDLPAARVGGDGRGAGRRGWRRGRKHAWRCARCGCRWGPTAAAQAGDVDGGGGTSLTRGHRQFSTGRCAAAAGSRGTMEKGKGRA